MKLSRYDLMTAKKKAVNTDPLNFYSWFSGIENQAVELASQQNAKKSPNIFHITKEPLLVVQSANKDILFVF
jgi:hypothetical protein